MFAAVPSAGVAPPFSDARKISVSGGAVGAAGGCDDATNRAMVMMSARVICARILKQCDDAQIDPHILTSSHPYILRSLSRRSDRGVPLIVRELRAEASV